MSSSTSLELSLTEAHELLKRFDCHRDDAEPLPEAPIVRQAILRVAQASDYQILGICADTETAGLAALTQYAQALNYTLDLGNRAPMLSGATYTKFNPRSGLCYSEPYTGTARGVIICCQSAYEDGLNETYGHLPLDLFSSLD